MVPFPRCLVHGPSSPLSLGVSPAWGSEDRERVIYRPALEVCGTAITARGGVDAVGAGEEEAGGRGPGCRGRLTASISGGGGVRGGARAVVAGTQPGVGL